MKDIPLLKPQDIEVKVKKVIDGKALLLLYKTSRVDMAILDEVYGSENWCDDYKEIKNNLYCGIGTRENKNDEFVWKWDCGIESKEDEEGNQKKGEASDAFKRAGFKLGIGRELYTAPVIWVDAETETADKKTKLKDKFAKYSVKEIAYENRVITKLIIVDRKGQQIFPKVNKQQTKPLEQPAIGPIKCNICGHAILPREINGEIRTPEQIKEKCNGMCLSCYQKLNAKVKPVELTDYTKVIEVEG